MTIHFLLTCARKWAASNESCSERGTELFLDTWMTHLVSKLTNVPQSATYTCSFLFVSLSLFSSVSIMKLMGSQQGNLNCNLKAFLNNFDSLKVAHHATCRVNKYGEGGGCEELYRKEWVNERRRATISIPETACVANYVWALWQGGCRVQ